MSYHRHLASTLDEEYYKRLNAITKLGDYLQPRLHREYEKFVERESWEDIMFRCGIGIYSPPAPTSEDQEHTDRKEK